MKKEKVYISYDYENERHYKNLLLAWNSNEDFKFLVNNPEIITEADFQETISEKISQASIFLVIVGKNAYQSEWVKREIEKAKELNKKIVAVKPERENIAPDGLYGIGTTWAMTLNFEAIKNAINKS